MMIEDEEKKEGISQKEGNNNGQPLSSANEDAFDEFVPPVRKEDKYDPQNGLAALFKPQEPKWDANREEHLQKVAKLSAFTDFLKHLGAFAGAGYAPVEKRQENQNVFRAFAELNKLRDTYKSDMDRYKDQVFNLNLRDYANQMDRADREYNREYDTAFRNWNAKQKIAQWDREKEFRKEERGENQKFTREENQKNRNDRKEALQDRLRNELKKAELKSQNKESFLTVSTHDGKVILTRSDAIAIGNRVSEMYSELQDKKMKGEELEPEEKKLLNDINVSIKTMDQDGGLSDNAIRVFAEKYYPMVVERYPNLTNKSGSVIDVSRYFRQERDGSTR